MNWSGDENALDLVELATAEAEEVAAGPGRGQYGAGRVAVRPLGPGSHQREQLKLLVRPSSRVGDILIRKGLVTREQVEEAVAAGGRKKVGALLLERQLVSEEQLLHALSIKFSIPFVDLTDVTPTPEALSALPKAVAEKMSVLPVERQGKRLVVATSQPTDNSIVDSLRFVTNLKIEMVIATSDQISKAIERYYSDPDSLELLIEDMADDEPVVVREEELATYVEPDSKVIRLVNKILIDAYNNGVSDIHFEPDLDKGPLRVRYRVDGECTVFHELPANHKSVVVARLKIMAKLDIAERRKPQSGKIVLLYDKKKLEYRVEITPTVEGQEDAVLRVLSGVRPMAPEQMGFSAQNLAKFLEVLEKPHGIILCVGPTGSGKTTTLHSALAAINSPERKIWTAEDPVEIIQKGLRQVQVNPKIGFGFDDAMRSFLRADPDVIMIGEIRDRETAKTAIAASLTGHLVFSTLHTNSAPETAQRLLEMGMDRFNFADALVAILAQRLARKLCDQCKAPYRPSLEEYERLVGHYDGEWFDKHGMPGNGEELRLMAKHGCPKCGGTGYHGRIALHELMIATPALKLAIKNNLGVEEIRGLAVREGMRTLKMDGIHKVFAGVTDLQQILKVCLL